MFGHLSVEHPAYADTGSVAHLQDVLGKPHHGECGTGRHLRSIAGLSSAECLMRRVPGIVSSTAASSRTATPLRAVNLVCTRSDLPPRALAVTAILAANRTRWAGRWHSSWAAVLTYM